MLAALPDSTSLHGGAPDPRWVYLPSSHVRALRPDCIVVSGMRGAGKSFWWAALQDVSVRAMVARLDVNAEIQKSQISVGFGERPNPALYPDRDTLSRLLELGTEPRLIWRTVFLAKLAGPGHTLASGPWSNRVQWVMEHPEMAAELLSNEDEKLEAKQTWFMVLFDALDRSATNWSDMYRLIRGLLEAALDLRPYRRLRVKCFLRTDQLDKTRVADFPDASKVLASPSMVELHWLRPDLYGLLWQYLANAPHSEAATFRQNAQSLYSVRWAEFDPDGVEVWRMIPEGRGDEIQRDLFHSLAGKWMGKDRRRGFPYSWIPSHLADAWGRTSPRSFLAALRAATEDTQRRYPNHDEVLHYESIKRGVQTASQIRVGELREDYPWVNAVMQPLQGLVVPCDFGDVAERWSSSSTLTRIAARAEEDRLPPPHLTEGHEGIRLDLEELGIFEKIGDGRVNVPDVFRVGYGLGRRGGVRPIGREGEV